MDVKEEKRGGPESPTPQIQGTQDKGKEKIPTFVKTGDYLLSLDIKEIRTLYGFFPVGAVSLVVGASDVGKSMFLRQLGMCTAAGYPFIGREFDGVHKKSIIACTEDDEAATSFFLNRQNKTLNINAEAFKNIRYIFDTSGLVEKLRAELEREPADVVVLDALGDLFTGKDLNANNQVRQFLHPFTGIAAEFGTAVVFLHHTSKRSEELLPSKNNSIGSQGIEAKCRLALELRQSRISPEIRHLCIVKGNYVSQADKIASLDLAMDENFVFSDTGRRTDFSDLGVNPRPKKAPEYVPKEAHIAFIQAAFHGKKDAFSTRQLTALAQTHFQVSDRTARKYIELYQANGWVRNISRSKACNQFVINELTEKLRV